MVVITMRMIHFPTAIKAATRITMVYLLGIICFSLVVSIGKLVGQGPLPVAMAFYAPGRQSSSLQRPLLQLKQQQQQQQQQQQNAGTTAFANRAKHLLLRLTAHRNTARTDVQNLLTQRALQSFIDLLLNCRDNATVRWLEQTYRWHNLEHYHGTAGIDLQKYQQWDDVLFDMLRRPSDTVVISAKRRGRGYGGWSKNNPFLEERFMEFEIDIDPPSLVARIISVRAQIAKDWVEDLRLLVQWNADCLEDASHADVSFPHAPSSFRTASLDLVALLATQESIHRLLRLDRTTTTYDALRELYVEKVAEYFDGSQKLKRFDEFLEAIQDEIVAQDIMQVRSMIFQEWTTIIQQTDHGNLQQIILAIRMGRTFDTSPTEERSIFISTKTGDATAEEDEGLEFFQ